MKFKATEELPEPVRVWVLKHKTSGYLGSNGWTESLQEAKKWNRQSDATQCKRKRESNFIKDYEPMSITFTHGFKKV